jgi:hypothetical protein
LISLLLLAATDRVSADAIWIGGIAVVLAALITFVGVYLQTVKTLSAERERLDDQLKAERDRLKLQLMHDRATRERAELRNVLDTAGVEMDALAFAAIRAATAAGLDPPDADHPADLPEVDRESLLRQRLDEQFEQHRKVDAHHAQMVLRLGPEHLVVTTYDAARSLFGELQERLMSGAETDFEKSKELIVAAGEKHGEFETHAYLLIGTQLDPG